eukprot:Nitzschia sp. Nitz4//scaffold10_size219509//181139//182200//NITZ4_001457-RA/size219509-processed-gene-0.95-mRNA-1//1//CDS//3329533007//3194//frame0
MLSNCKALTATSFRLLFRGNNVRTHMNHGAPHLSPPPIEASGPRSPLELGFDTAKVTQNLLRLLESSHGLHNYRYAGGNLDIQSPAWHPAASSWTWKEDVSSWEPQAYQSSAPSEYEQVPTLSWLQFSDERTAMAKLDALDGTQRYLSLLKVDDGRGVPANDGWVIVREVVCPSTAPAAAGSALTSLAECLQDYLNIEHGGGSEDYQKATELFAPQSSLLTVGIAPSTEPPTDWSAPVGSFLEIPLEKYLSGVKEQTPHRAESRSCDAIVQLDCTPNGMAAAATVHVGNGAQSLVFVDHLLLGRQSENSWAILSKTFSPQPWKGAAAQESTIPPSASTHHHHEHSHDHHHHHH